MLVDIALNRSKLQSRKWQRTDMSSWYRSALCSHTLAAPAKKWTRGAVSVHTTAHT